MTWEVFLYLIIFIHIVHSVPLDTECTLEKPLEETSENATSKTNEQTSCRPVPSIFTNIPCAGVTYPLITGVKFLSQLNSMTSNSNSENESSKGPVLSLKTSGKQKSFPSSLLKLLEPSKACPSTDSNHAPCDPSNLNPVTNSSPPTHIYKPFSSAAPMKSLQNSNSCSPPPLKSCSSTDSNITPSISLDSPDSNSKSKYRCPNYYKQFSSATPMKPIQKSISSILSLTCSIPESITPSSTSTFSETNVGSSLNIDSNDPNLKSDYASPNSYKSFSSSPFQSCSSTGINIIPTTPCDYSESTSQSYSEVKQSSQNCSSSLETNTTTSSSCDYNQSTSTSDYTSPITYPKYLSSSPNVRKSFRHIPRSDYYSRSKYKSFCPKYLPQQPCAPIQQSTESCSNSLESNSEITTPCQEIESTPHANCLSPSKSCSSFPTKSCSQSSGSSSQLEHNSVGQISCKSPNLEAPIKIPSAPLAISPNVLTSSPCENQTPDYIHTSTPISTCYSASTHSEPGLDSSYNLENNSVAQISCKPAIYEAPIQVPISTAPLIIPSCSPDALTSRPCEDPTTDYSQTFTPITSYYASNCNAPGFNSNPYLPSTNSNYEQSYNFPTSQYEYPSSGMFTYSDTTAYCTPKENCKNINLHSNILHTSNPIQLDKSGPILSSFSQPGTNYIISQSSPSNSASILASAYNTISLPQNIYSSPISGCIQEPTLQSNSVSPYDILSSLPYATKDSNSLNTNIPIQYIPTCSSINSNLQPSSHNILSSSIPKVPELSQLIFPISSLPPQVQYLSIPSTNQVSLPSIPDALQIISALSSKSTENIGSHNLVDTVKLMLINNMIKSSKKPKVFTLDIPEFDVPTLCGVNPYNLDANSMYYDDRVLCNSDPTLEYLPYDYSEPQYYSSSPSMSSQFSILDLDTLLSNSIPAETLYYC